MPTDDGGTTKVVLLPLTLGGRRPGVRRPLPRIGEHTEEILLAARQPTRWPNPTYRDIAHHYRRQDDFPIHTPQPSSRFSPPPAPSSLRGSGRPSAADKPLRMILPVGAGSGVDTIMRAAGTSLTKALGGQPVVIENLPGAGGITGTSAIVKAAPDGNTIGVVSNNHAVNPSVFKKMPYDA